MQEEGTDGRSFAKTARLAVAFALVLVIGFAGGIGASATGTSRVFSTSLFGGLSATPDETADLSDFWRAWNVLNQRFVPTTASSSDPTIKERIWGAIQGLTESYGDPYTVYMPPEEAKMFEEDISGNFEGVGMELALSAEGALTVIAPLKDTPAERAGILTGDIIVSINDRPAEGMTTDEAVKIIRGPKGTTVTFRMLRQGEVVEIPVVRAVIDVPTIATKLEDGVFSIALYSFTANSSQKFSQALAEFRASGSDKLIVDLRGNPGGYLDAAVQMASRFLPKGTEVVTEDYQGNRENLVHRSTGSGGVPENAKVVVLINQGSASASEILAGALQDADRATLIGARSFGKGSVQELIDLGGGALKVTVARWLTPSGRSISDGGLTPDIVVDRTIEDVQANRDPQLDRAKEFLRTGK